MRPAAAFLTLAVLLITGCGGGGSKQLSAAEYRAKLAAIGKEVDAAQSGVQQGLRATTVAALATSLETFAASQQRAGDEVAKLKAPDDAKAANAELAAGLRSSADALTQLLPKVKAQPTPRAALALLGHSEAAGAAGQQVDHAITVLKKLGYSKGS